MKVRAENTTKQWNGIIVENRFFEERQPQDLVRGVPDDQAVPEPRPRQPDQFMVTATYMTAVTAQGGTVLQVADGIGFNPGDSVSVMLDSGVAAVLTLASVSRTVLTLTSGLPGQAGTFDNTVQDLTVPVRQGA